MNKNQRQLLVPVSLKSKVSDYAWSKRSTTSAVIAGIVTDYAKGEPQPPAVTDKEEMAKIRSSVPDEVWMAAQKRADVELTSISQVVRAALTALVVG